MLKPEKTKLLRSVYAGEEIPEDLWTGDYIDLQGV